MKEAKQLGVLRAAVQEELIAMGKLYPAETYKPHPLLVKLLRSFSWRVGCVSQLETGCVGNLFTITDGAAELSSSIAQDLR